MRLIGVDSEKSGPEKGMTKRFLIVDDALTRDWKLMFKEAMQRYIYPRARAIQFVGANIVVECELMELQEQIDIIKKWCEIADQLLTERYESQLAQEQAKRDAEEKLRNDSIDAYLHLKF